MPRVSSRPRVWTVVGVGVVAALTEIGFTFARAYDHFLGRNELLLYSASAVACWVGLIFVGHVGGRVAARFIPAMSTRAALGGVVVGGLMGVLAWESASGRRLESYRFLVGIGAALLCGWTARRVLLRWNDGAWEFARPPLIVAATAFVAADTWLLHRLYPRFHLALLVTALGLYWAASFAGEAGVWVARSTATLIGVALTTLALAAVLAFGED